MEFSAADYQGMAQSRKRKRNNGQQAANQSPMSAAPNAKNAGQSSSRQGTAALNRARPGVPGMPVQGLDSPPTSQSSQSDAPNAKDISTPRTMPASIQTLANSGAMGAPATNSSDPNQVAGVNAYSTDGPSGFLGGSSGGYSGLMGNAPSGGGGEFAAGTGGAPEVAPGMEDFRLLGQGKGAMHDEIRNAETGEYRNFGGGGFGQSGLIGSQDTGTQGAGEDSEYFDRLAEERAMFDQYMSDLEAERGESQGLIIKGISEQQRRQAEMNALAGRSVGGGFGGAMATTSAMGAAAMEEADRAIRGKMREAQLGWLDKVSSLNESERGRAFAEQMSDEDKAHDLDIKSIESMDGMPMGAGEGGAASNDWVTENQGQSTGSTGTGGTGTGGTGGGGGVDLPGNAGTGQSEGTGEEFDPNDASAQALYREGWRPTPNGLRNSEGQTWEEVYPDSAPPLDNSMQGYSSSISYSDDDSVMNNDDYGISEEHAQAMAALPPDQREQYMRDNNLSSNPMASWYDGEMSFEDAVSQMVDALDDESYRWEDAYEQMADEVFWDDTTYSDENGNTVRGDQLKDLVNNMADAAGWNNAELSLGNLGSDSNSLGGLADLMGVHGQEYYDDNYGNTNVNDDPDKLYMWVMSQPGLFREIVNRSLYSVDQSGSSGAWGSTDFANEILAELQQSGLLDPGR